MYGILYWNQPRIKFSVIINEFVFGVRISLVSTMIKVSRLFFQINCKLLYYIMKKLHYIVSKDYSWNV